MSDGENGKMVTHIDANAAVIPRAKVRKMNLKACVIANRMRESQRFLHGGETFHSKKKTADGGHPETIQETSSDVLPLSRITR